MTDPLLELLRDAASLMNRAFIDEAKPAGAMCEFYHQFRKLWDRGIPVGMGLGHLLMRGIDEATLGIHRLGENGRSGETLAAVRFSESSAPVEGYARTFTVTVADGRIAFGEPGV